MHRADQPPPLSSGQRRVGKLIGQSLPFSCWIDCNAFRARQDCQYQALLQLLPEYWRQRYSSFFVNLILIPTVEHVVSPGSPQLSPILSIPPPSTPVLPCPPLHTPFHHFSPQSYYKPYVHFVNTFRHLFCNF